MLKLTDEQMKACYASGYFRRYTFVFDDFTIDASMIHTESVIIKESICEDTELKLGGCIASSCEFEVSETVTNRIDLSGMRFQAYLHLYRENTEPHMTDDDNEDWAIGEEIGVIPMGVYNVRSVEMVDDQDYKKVTAYDDLHDWNVNVADWYNQVFPSDIKTITYTDSNGNIVDESQGIPEDAVQKTTITHVGIPVGSVRCELLKHLMSLNGELDEQKYRQVTSKTYINDDVKITKTMQTDGNGTIMGLDVLRYLCELAGGFGVINRYGLFDIVFLGTFAGLYPADTLYPEDSKSAEQNLYPEDNFLYLGGSGGDGDNPDLISTHYEEFDVQPISCVTFSANSAKQSTDEEGNVSEENTVVGVSYPENATENPYVSSNPFVLELPAEDLRKVAQEVFGMVGNIIYRPNTTVTQGVPYYDPGDYYNVSKDISFESFIFSRTLTGIQGLRDEFVATGIESRENNVSAETTSYTTMAKYMNIEKNSERLAIEIGDSEANQKTAIEITAQGLSSTVASSQYAWDDNKYQIDEYGFGTPKLDAKVRYEYDTTGYENVTHVYKLPTATESLYYKNYCNDNTGIIYRVQAASYTGGRHYFYWKKIAEIKEKTAVSVFDYSASDVGKTYLDQSTGNLYKLVGWNLTSENPQFRWDVIAHLEKVTVQLETKITQTAEEIRLEASRTYATDSYVKSQFSVVAGQISSEVEARKGDTETLKSNIIQTASQIESSVSKNSDTWDSTGYNIVARGYGLDGSNYKNYASDYLIYSGYYLDEQTGRIYRINSSSRTDTSGVIRLNLSYVKQATRTTENLSSRIRQTAHSIEMTTTDGAKSAGITIQIRDENGNVLDSASDNITLTGVVGFEDLSGEGRTTINGANIKTGTIDANRINLTGYLKASDVSSGGSTIIDGARIQTGTIDADRINLKEIASKTNGQVIFPNNSGIQVGSSGQYTSIGYGQIDTTVIHSINQDLLLVANSYFSVRSENGNYFYGNSFFDKQISVDGNAWFNGNYCCMRRIEGISSKDGGAVDIECNGLYIYPGSKGMNVNGKIYSTGVRDSTTTSSANMHCGVNYGQFFRSTASSKRYKHDITEDFNDALDPHNILRIPVKQYKYNTDYLSDQTDQRYDTDVIGFIAEDMQEHYPIACEFDSYGMVDDWNARFIIPPMLSLIQELYQRIEVLENRISILGGN